MFQSKTYLEKHTGRFGSERSSYLQMLVTEFQDTANDEHKEQILANLANFSYDPINYEWIRKLNIIDLFLDMLTEPKEKIVEFAMSGICNLCCDRHNQDVILKNNGIALIKKCLSSSNEETVLSAITTLYFMVNPKTRAEIVTKGVLAAIQAYSHAPSVRLKNLAKAFIEQHTSRNYAQQPNYHQQQAAYQQQYANYNYAYNQQYAAAGTGGVDQQQAAIQQQYAAYAGYNYDPNYAAAQGYTADASEYLQVTDAAATAATDHE